MFPFEWTKSLCVISAWMLVTFFLFGFWYDWWRVADMDFWMVYNAFLLNDGLPQEFFDHTGYLSIILLSNWFRLLHAIGFLDVHTLSGLPSVSDTIAFAQAWKAATQAGRLLSLGIAIVFVASFASLVRILVRDWRIASAAALFLALSGSVSLHARIMRTELISGSCLTIAILVLLYCAQNPRLNWRPLLVGLASFLSGLAIINKVQALFVICAFPIIVFPFGVRPECSRSWNDYARDWSSIIGMGLVGLAIATPALLLISIGFSNVAMSGAGLSPIVNSVVGSYQIFVIAWIVTGMLAFALYWHVPTSELIATMIAVFVGFALALLTLVIRYHPNNVVIALNPMEQMLVFASVTHPELTDGQPLLGWSKLPLLVESIGRLFAHRTFDLHSRPTIFLEWVVIAVTVIAWRCGERKLPYQIMVLLCTVWLIDLLAMIGRGRQIAYHIFTDPLIIIAAALLFAKLVWLQNHRLALPVGIALIGSHVIVGQAEPVKKAFSRSGAEVICGLYHNARRVERFPFCDKRPQSTNAKDVTPLRTSSSEI